MFFKSSIKLKSICHNAVHPMQIIFAGFYNVEHFKKCILFQSFVIISFLKFPLILYFPVNFVTCN